MEEDLLANVDREAVKSDLLLRPRVSTTADRHGTSGDLHHELVYFDWQQHWSSVKMLFQRTDVRYSACQHVQGRHRCKYCTEYWFETQKATRWDHQPFWPPLETDGCQGKVFPLLLDHDGQDIGGDGSAKTDLALSIMPDAMADRLIQEQLDELDERGHGVSLRSDAIGRASEARVAVDGGRRHRPWDSTCTDTRDPVGACDLLLQTDEQTTGTRLG